MSDSPFGPMQPETTPSAQVPQTAPRLPNFADERDSVHTASALGIVRERIGELTGTINSQTSNISELKTELKGIDGRVAELKTEQVANARAIKWVGGIATAVVSVTTWFAPSYWSKAMQPEMEKNIASSVKIELAKEQEAREKTLALEKKITELEAKLKTSYK
jgi:hypothetical protein